MPSTKTHISPGLFLSSILFILPVFFSSLNAQSLEWAIGLNGSGNEIGTAIVTDDNGNVYTAGTFTGTVDFDPAPGTSDILTAAGSDDIFIQKLDSSGNLVWIKSFEGPGVEGVNDIVLRNNNLYLTGFFHDTVDFNPGSGDNTLTAETNSSVFVVKLDLDGDYVWARSAANKGMGQGTALVVDNGGKVYVTGIFGGNVDFDSHPIDSLKLQSNGSMDVFMMKLKSNGDFDWAKSFGGSGYDLSTDMKIDQDNNLVCVGYYRSTVDFDPHETNTNNIASKGGMDIFIERLSNSGNFVDMTSLGSTSDDNATALTFDDNDNLLLVGHYKNTVDFDPSASGSGLLTASSAADMFVLKLDDNMNFDWVRSFGGSNWEQIEDVATDGNGNVVTTGYFYGSVDFDPGASTTTLTSHGVGDIFVSMLDDEGTLTWAYHNGGSAEDGGKALFIDSSDKIFVTGNFQSIADFGPNDEIQLDGGNSQSMFVQQVEYTPSTNAIAEVIELDIKLYPNPATDYMLVNGLHNDGQLGLFSLLGKQVLTLSTNAGQTRIDTSLLPAGIYLLKYEYAGATSVKRIAIRR